MSEIDNYTVSLCLQISEGLDNHTRLALADMSVFILPIILDEDHPDYRAAKSNSKLLSGHNSTPDIIWHKACCGELYHPAGTVTFEQWLMTRLNETIFRRLLRKNRHYTPPALIAFHEKVIEELLTSTDLKDVIAGHIEGMNMRSRLKLVRAWIQAGRTLIDSASPRADIFT